MEKKNIKDKSELLDLLVKSDNREIKKLETRHVRKIIAMVCMTIISLCSLIGAFWGGEGLKVVGIVLGIGFSLIIFAVGMSGSDPPF